MTPPQTGTLESLALALAGLLAPLGERIEEGNMRGLLAELGLQFPDAFDGINTIDSAGQTIAGTIRQLPPKISALVAAIEAEDYGQIVSLSFQLVDIVGKTVDNIDKLATAIKNAGGSTGIPAGEVTTFANELPEKLIQYLIVTNMERVPGLAETLDFIGVVDRSTGNAGSVDPNKPPFTRHELHIDALIDFLQDPKAQLQTLYGWDSPGFTGDALLNQIASILTKAGMPAIVDTSVSPPVLDIFFVEISPATDLNPKGLRIAIAEQFGIGNSGTFTLDDLTIETGFDASFDVGTEITVQPGDKINVIPPSGDFKGDAFIKLTAGKADGTPYIILGQANGSRIEAKQFSARAGAGFAWTGDHAEGEFTILGEVKKGKIFIGMDEADGFLGTILSGIKVESEFDLGLGYSTSDGVFFTGSSTLDIQLPLHVALGPVELNALTISVGLSPAGFPIGLAVDIKAMLGPLQAVVEQIGIEATLSLPPGQDGNLGVVDFSLGFQAAQRRGPVD